MFIHDTDVKEKTITIDTNPLKVIYLEPDGDGLLQPDFMRITRSIPKEGMKAKVDVVSNGYIVVCGNTTKVVPFNDWGNTLEKAMNFFLNHDVEEERDLTEDELEDDNLIQAVADLQVAYMDAGDL